MKFNDYPIAQAAPEDGYILVDSDSEGTQRVPALGIGGEVLPAVSSIMPSVSHRNYFRGKFLETSITAAQYAAIADGSFEDLYVGDYWTINGINWRIADFNYWINTGDQENGYQKPHIIIVPDTPLYNGQMNATNVTTGGYTGSAMYKTGLAQAKNTITTIFGSSHIVNHRELLTNTVTNGIPTAGAWFDSTAELMTSQMVYGNATLLPSSTGSTVPYQYTVDKTQLALFQMAPEFINIRENYWLRDVINATAFAGVHYDGGAGTGHASTSLGVRVAFGVC